VSVRSTVPKIAVVGPGLIGIDHISRIVNSPSCDLHSIICPTGQSGGNGFLSEFPWFSSIEACLNEHPPPDGMIIASPTEFHAAQMAVCVDASIPCLVEKPICAKSSELGAWLEGGRSLRNVLVGHHRHHSAATRVAKQWLDSQKIGSVRTVVATAQYNKPASYFKEKPWRTSPSSGGPLLINAIHDIGLMHLLIGPIKRVVAIGRESSLNAGVEGIVSASLEFTNGAIGSITVSDEVCSAGSWEVSSGENEAFPKYEHGFSLMIGGAAGAISLPQCILLEDIVGGDWKHPMNQHQMELPVEDPLVNQLNHFIDVILGIDEPQVTVTNALANLAVIEAIKKSLATGSITEVDGRGVF
jgi:predicted dehydrogenase